MIVTPPSTYSLRVVMQHLDSKGLSYSFSSGPVGPSIYEHGCRLELPCSCGDVKMSIQTHPTLVGPAFAETAIIKDGKLIWFKMDDRDDGNDVMRHDTPEQLFEHIRMVIKHFGNRQIDNAAYAGCT